RTVNGSRLCTASDGRHLHHGANWLARHSAAAAGRPLLQPRCSARTRHDLNQGETSMREAVVVASSRTPLAKSFRGSFNLTRPDDLAAHCIQDVLRKTPQLDAAEVEDVILGCAYPHGTQGNNVARIASMRAGLPVTVPGVRANRFCSSGLQAIAMSAHEIVQEGAEAAIGGGVDRIPA